MTLIGCSDTYDENLGLVPTQTPRFIEISKSILSFEANPQQKQTLTVSSINTSWQIVNDSKWITLSVKSENVTDEKNTDIDVLPLENTSVDTARIHTIWLKTLTGDRKSIPIIINQSAARPYIIPEQDSIVLSGKSQTKTISVQSNTNWLAISALQWVKVVRENNKLVVNVAGNITEHVRRGTIAVASSISSFITIEQAPADLYVKSDTIVFDRISGSYSLDVKADLEWQVYTNDSWIQVYPVNGNAGEFKITVYVTPNYGMVERLGSVYVTMGAKSIEIPVRQRF